MSGLAECAARNTLVSFDGAFETRVFSATDAAHRSKSILSRRAEINWTTKTHYLLDPTRGQASLEVE